MTLVSVVHPAPYAAYPRRGNVLRHGHVRATSTAEIHDVPFGEFAPVGEIPWCDVAYYERGGALWIRARHGHRDATPADLAAFLADDPGRERSGLDHIRNALSRTPVSARSLANGTAGDSRGEAEGLDRFREVVDDGTARAAASVQRFLAEDVLVSGDGVMFRSRGPLACFAGRHPGTMVFPNREWQGGLACRPDLAGELWAFLNRRASAPGPMPGPVPDYACVPARLLPDEIHLMAQVLPALAASVADGHARLDRGCHGGEALARQATDLAATVRDGETGQVREEDAEGAILAAASLLEAATAVHAAALAAGRRWAEGMAGADAGDLAAYARTVALPRLWGRDRTAPEDAEALHGLGI